MQDVTVELKVKMKLAIFDNFDIQTVLENLDYEFKSQNREAEIIDTEIHDWEWEARTV